MNKEKINDFVNVWAQVVGLTETRYINVIKNDIAKRCAMYEKEIPSISTKDDDCKAYIIKPINGEYSLEDFFLNRLMLGLREVDFTGALEGNGGEYTAHYKSLNVNVGLLNTKINEKSARHAGLQGKNVQIIKKTIEHELGHCFKSSFTNGYKAPLGGKREQDSIYENLINNLQNYRNGKYASQIKTIQELDSQGQSDVIKTGVHDAQANYKHDYRVQWIDELLNETEALELTNSNEVHEKWELQDEQGRNSATGNYVNVYNYISGYSTFTGYGSILKALLGKEDSFSAEYISSVDIFKKFDEEYADIVQDVWGLDPKQMPPMRCIFIDFDDLVHGKFFNEQIMLKLDEFFAKCYERKIEKSINQGNGTLSQESREAILKDIEQFQSRLTTNDDPQKREQLAHNIVFDNIKTRINELSIQNSQPEIAEDIKAMQQEDLQQDNQQSEKTDSPKMKFVKGFIQAYNDTEEEYQYEKRANDDLMDIKRLQDIIETNGMNRMLISDLDGKWIGRPGDEDFKVQYSQKQVSAMARLLKVAQLLTESKKLNPEGRNYLEEFTNIPDIEYKLKQMKEDFKDENSYMYELRQRAKDTRANGTIPSYPPTQAEIDASDNSPSTIGQGLKQEMGTSKEKSEELKAQTSSNKIQISNVIDTISQSKVTTSETQQQTKAMDDTLKIKRLMYKQRSGAVLTDEEKNLIEQHIRQTNEAQVRFRNQQVQKKSNGLEM